MNILKSYKKVKKAMNMLDRVLEIFQNIWDKLEKEVNEADRIIEMAEMSKKQAKESQKRVEKFIK